MSGFLESCLYIKYRQIHLFRILQTGFLDSCILELSSMDPKGSQTFRLSLPFFLNSDAKF